MNDSAGLSQADPLSGSAIVGRWSFGYDMPDELGGGFVSGELLLRTDGILLRRYGGSSHRARQVTWKYGPWDEVTWWTGETNPSKPSHFSSPADTTCSSTTPCPSTSPPTAPPPARLPPACPSEGQSAETAQPRRSAVSLGRCGTAAMA